MSPPSRIIHVSAAQAGDKLQNVLRATLPEQSWSHIKKLIADRHVQLNGNVCSDGQRVLHTSDVLHVSERPFVPPVQAADVRLVHVDEHVVVVDKPPGVTTLRHVEEREWSSRRKNCEPTLEEWIEKLLMNPRPPSTRGRRESKPPTVIAVHRLDRDTSGLMVFARKREAATLLIRQFKKHTVQRMYLAMIVGQLPAQTFDSFFVRDRGDGLRGSALEPLPPDAERAITHIEPLEQLHGYSVLQCRLETGRTHQIRIHLSEAGHPLCGEKVYTQRLHGEKFNDASGAPRQMLHAALLGFVHPHTQQPLQFISPLPRDMLKIVERCRKPLA